MSLFFYLLVNMTNPLGFLPLGDTSDNLGWYKLLSSNFFFYNSFFNIYIYIYRGDIKFCLCIWLEQVWLMTFFKYLNLVGEMTNMTAHNILECLFLTGRVKDISAYHKFVFSSCWARVKRRTNMLHINGKGVVHSTITDLLCFILFGIFVFCVHYLEVNSNECI